MADLVINPADVQATSGSQNRTRGGIAGEPINAGQSISIDQTTNQVFKSDKTVDGRQRCDGIAVNTAEKAGQPISYMPPGTSIDLGSVLTVSETYVISTVGGLSPIADLASAQGLAYCGYATSVTSLVVLGITTDVVKP